MRLNKNFFKNPKNDLETGPKEIKRTMVKIPEEMCVICPSCQKTIFKQDLFENKKVCPFCKYHFKMTARQRLAILADEKSFKEHDKRLTSKNIIDFPDYEKKLEKTQAASKEHEAVVTGVCTIGSYECAVFVMEAGFIMGSMGSVVGEKITNLFEYATKKMLPVIGVTVSGGARMQEGIVSLIQMAKVSGAVKMHSDAGNLYAALLTDPTMGGVTASFAMLGDVIIAEPNALIGFAGPRVIEQTMRQKLPNNFQKAESLMESGFLDDIVDRRAQKEYLIKLLKLHSQ